MNDNFFGCALFASVVAVAIAAASAIVDSEIDLARADPQAAAQPAAPASASAMQVLELPAVTVVGHREALVDEPDTAVALAPVPAVPRVH